jgi:DNA-binding protein Alba
MEQKERKITDEILVGEKPLFAYVRSLEMVLRNGKSATIKARGRNIGRAVDLALSSQNKFLKALNLKIESVEISTENFNKEGRDLSVSAIKIVISK